MRNLIEDARIAIYGKEPESIQELPLGYRQLVFDYQQLKATHERVHQEFNDVSIYAQDNILEELGHRIRHRTLRVTNEALEVARLPFIPSKERGYLEIGSLYWFFFEDQRLTPRQWELKRDAIGRLKPNADNLPDVQMQAWFVHGLEVANKTLEFLSKKGRLPSYLTKIPDPA